MDDYVQVFLDSISRNLTLVNEVIFVKVTGKEFRQETHIGNISVKIFGFPITKSVQNPTRNAWLLNVCGHALGLHHAIEQASQPFIMLSDPDIFFLGPVDQIYLDLFNQFDLGIVGIAHFNSREQCYLDFPCITNCLMKKQDLPDAVWLEDQIYLRSDMRTESIKMLRLDGKYLMPGKIPEKADEFPNPSGYFDAGCNLWLWGKNRRWLSFLLPEDQKFSVENYGFRNLVYPMNYNTGRSAANWDVPALKPIDLLYHRTRGTREDGAGFKALYQEVLAQQI